MRTSRHQAKLNIIAQAKLLSIGKCFKNYPTLCAFLGIPILTGSAKQTHFSAISTHVTFLKRGQHLKVTSCKTIAQLEAEESNLIKLFPKHYLSSYHSPILPTLFLKLLSAESKGIFLTCPECYKALGFCTSKPAKTCNKELRALLIFLQEEGCLTFHHRKNRLFVKLRRPFWELPLPTEEELKIPI
jgi:hypothetical protein